MTPREIVIDRYAQSDGTIRFSVQERPAFYALLNPAILHVVLPEHRLLNWMDMEEILMLHHTVQTALKALVEAQWAKEDEG